MDKEKFIESFDTDDTDYAGDNVFQGLVIIAKYIDPKKYALIGVGHDQLFSVNVDALLKMNITEEDVRELVKLGWFIEDDALSCFV